MIQTAILTLFLAAKAFIGGLILTVLDLIALIKATARWCVAALLGIRKEPIVVQWRGIPSVLTIPYLDDMDFNFWRKPTYVIPTLTAMVKHKVLMLKEQKRVSVIPDAELADWVLKGPLSRLVVEHEGFLVADLSAVETVETDEDVFLRGPTLRLKAGTFEIESLTFTNGEVARPTDGGKWALAKLHFQAAATFLLPGRFHGNIHFGLPCTVAASLAQLPKGSVLRQLLAPHLRFTLRINNEALRVQRAQDRSKAYAPFPVTGDEFTRSIAADVTEHLLEPGMQSPPWSLAGTELPFNQFGQAYYQDILSFVNEVAPHFETAEVQQWQSFMDQYIPRFSEQPLNETLATIIWQVSFLHSADHYTMEHLMQADRYIFCKPHLPQSSECAVKETMSDTQVVSLACDVEDRYRSNVFNRTFVAGHKHLLWSNTMDNIKYRFRKPELKDAAQRFQSALLNTEKTLDAQGLNLTPLNHVFQSICW